MNLKNEKTYKEWKEIQKDPYGLACFKYAEKWMDLMEEGLNQGMELKDIWKDLSHEADKNIGITGFMYGMAVNILSECWEYGEQLRKLHNEDYGASEYKGVINPAIIHITTDKDLSKDDLIDIIKDATKK